MVPGKTVCTKCKKPGHTASSFYKGTVCSICGKKHPANVCWFREDDSTPADSPAAASHERRVNVKNAFTAALNKLKNKTGYYIGISRFVLTEGCAEGAEPILSSFNDDGVEDAEVMSKSRGHTKITEIEIGDHSMTSLSYHHANQQFVTIVTYLISTLAVILLFVIDIPLNMIL